MTTDQSSVSGEVGKSGGSITVTAAPLEEKVLLTAGSDFWHVGAAPSLGLEPMRVTDGPNGARGTGWGAELSVCLPCGTALAATWDPDLVERVGRVLGAETRAKGAVVLLAPTVNMHRHPLAGRNFECFSEDPLLTAEMAVAYIRGVQSEHVSCVVKHFVCNDQETGRMNVDVRVDERPLREIYLPPFEAAVQRAGVWAVMAAYNKLDGLFCSQQPRLLNEILRREWGFDGVVMSDWFGTHSTEAINAGLDVEMPGPATYLGERLLPAIEDGRVDEATVDRAVVRVAGLAAKTTPVQRDHEDAVAVARRGAAAGSVLLRNDGLLPLSPAAGRRLALIGPYADRLTPQGGGSAEVTPAEVSSLLRALSARPGLEVVHEPGCATAGPVRDIDRRRMESGGEPGTLRVDYIDGTGRDGPVIGTASFHQSRILWNDPPPGAARGAYAVRVSTVLTPDVSGDWRIGLTSVGEAQLFLDGRLLLDNTVPMPGGTFFGFGSTEITAQVAMEAGVGYDVHVELTGACGPMGIRALEIGAEAVLPPDAVDRAVAAAAAADVAVVVVGADRRFESEGFDRADLRLRGDQDALVRAIALANPRTVVVVNTGSPVEMEWADDVAAILQLWYPGQEAGEALADVLLGDAEPGGRLPTTFPRRVEDSPAHAFYPGAGVAPGTSVPGPAQTEGGTATYAEGLAIGYRHFDRSAAEPLFCFGHGLSYTTFEYGPAEVGDRDGLLTVRVPVINTGDRPGSDVVQIYVRPVAPVIERPDKELKAFAKVHLDPGGSCDVEAVLDERAFSHWDVETNGWAVEPGTYEILVGASSRDIRRTVTVKRR